MQQQVFRLKKQMMLEGESGAEALVLIDGHTGSMCVCNTSAGAIVGLLRDGATQAELSHALALRFEIPSDRASRDARGFLQALSAMGAIEVVLVGDRTLPEWGGNAESQLA